MLPVSEFMQKLLFFFFLFFTSILLGKKYKYRHEKFRPYSKVMVLIWCNTLILQIFVLLAYLFSALYCQKTSDITSTLLNSILMTNSHRYRLFQTAFAFGTKEYDIYRTEFSICLYF